MRPTHVIPRRGRAQLGAAAVIVPIVLIVEADQAMDFARVELGKRFGVNALESVQSGQLNLGETPIRMGHQARFEARVAGRVTARPILSRLCRIGLLLVIQTPVVVVVARLGADALAQALIQPAQIGGVRVFVFE